MPDRRGAAPRGRTAADRRHDRYQVIVRDAFARDEVPRHLTTAEFLAEVHRVLRPGGVYLANIGDAAVMDLARSETATALTVFGRAVLIAEPAHFHGRRYG